MSEATRFYGNGRGLDPIGIAQAEVANPATARSGGGIALDNSDAAVAAAGVAFDGWSYVFREERLSYLRNINAALIARNDEIADATGKCCHSPTPHV